MSGHGSLPVTLLTDYGHGDEFAGVCHGVIARAAPDARVIDVTHDIPRYDVLRGAIVLRNALPYLPAGVHVAVVDPQVGSERRAIAVLCADGRVLVGPDNGLLSLAWEVGGGAELAVDISRSRHRLEPVSATFHGRDLFAPVAGAIAAGEPVEDAGEPIETDALVRLDLPRARVEDGVVIAHVLTIDRFGNAALDLAHEELAGTGLTLGRAVTVETAAREHVATFTTTFADVEPGALIAYEDAHRTLALAVNRGDASSTLALSPGDEVRLRAR